MLKQLCLAALMFFLSSSLSAQNCPIVNGSFEDWSDITLDIDTTETLPLETVLVPTNYFSLFRLFFASFGQVFGAVTDVDLAMDYLGIERSEDASDGDYALKLAGNEVFPIADVTAIFPCNGQLPKTFYLDLKHIGTGLDTLDFFITFGATVIIPQDLNDLFRTSGFVVGQAVADIETEWATLEIPITDNEIGIPADSVFMWFITTSDSSSIASQEESYFLLDKLSFGRVSNTTEAELLETVEIFPNPFRDKIYIKNVDEPLEAQLYDINGRQVSTFHIAPGVNEHNLEFLQNSGHYFLELKSKRSRKSFILVR